MQKADPECAMIRQFIYHQKEVPKAWKQAIPHMSITTDDVIVHGTRVFIPILMRREMLRQLHGGHFGIDRCRSRARLSVWWPGIGSELTKFVLDCNICRIHSASVHEPLMYVSFPTLPWSKIAMDFMEHQGKIYLVIQDYYSKYLQCILVSSTSGATVVSQLQRIFAQFGLPHTIMADNQPLNSQVVTTFLKQYAIALTTSSPRFAQSNGQSEKAVSTCKADPHEKCPIVGTFTDLQLYSIKERLVPSRTHVRT
jgi:hypothetical protein